MVTWIFKFILIGCCLESKYPSRACQVPGKFIWLPLKSARWGTCWIFNGLSYWVDQKRDMNTFLPIHQGLTLTYSWELSKMKGKMRLRPCSSGWAKRWWWRKKVIAEECYGRRKKKAIIWLAAWSRSELKHTLVRKMNVPRCFSFFPSVHQIGTRKMTWEILPN